MDMCSWHKVDRYKKSMKLRVIREGRNKEDMGKPLLRVGGWACGKQGRYGKTSLTGGWVGMLETRKIWETSITGGWVCWKDGRYKKPI